MDNIENNQERAKKLFGGNVDIENIDIYDGLSPDESRAQTLIDAIDQVAAIDAQAAAFIREKFEHLLPNDDVGPDGSQKYDGLKIWRVLPDGKWFYGRNVFPTDCPIIPLGRGEKDIYYFLDGSGDLHETSIKGQTELEGLFGEQMEYLFRGWPMNKAEYKGNIVEHKLSGYYAHYARQCLIAECARKGKFEVQNRVRGRGGWLDDDGNLILHVGNAILKENEAEKCGILGEYIYPTGAAIPRPVAGTREEIADLLSELQKFTWQRPDKDPYLLLGWLATAIVTGALEWRPMVFVDAGAGSGKTTLQKYIRNILHGRVRDLEEASPASLRAAIGNDALAISYDEAEAKANGGGQMSVIELARLASSGGRITRATKDQTVKEFRLRAGMMFSAINIPKMEQQDEQRFVFLKLKKIPDGAPDIVLKSNSEARDLGQKLAGRMVAGWKRWQVTFKAYRRLLGELGHSPRGRDQFGTLLAAADCVLFDEFDENYAAEIVNDYQPKTLEEYENLEENWFSCFRHILQTQPDVWRQSGGYPSIGKIIGDFVRAARGNQLAKDDPAYEDIDVSTKNANKKLMQTGLKCVRGHDGKIWLAVPNKHPATAKIFNGTNWVHWGHALGQSPKFDGENGIHRKDMVQMMGTRPQCVLINLDAIHDFGDGVKRRLFEFEEVEDGK